jgi:hypothetical protein
MRAELSKLAQLVIAYYEKFGRYVPESGLRLLDAGDLAAILRDSLATSVSLSETGWGWPSPMECGLRGCILRVENPERATPTKGPDVEWLQ